MRFKKSNYVIAAECDNSTSAVDLFSTRSSKAIRVARDVWDHVQHARFDSISEADLMILSDSKILVPEDENELQIVLADNEDAMRKDSSLYMVIQPTASCQLGCGYCGQRHTSQHMSPDSQAAFLERVGAKLFGRERPYKLLKIGWFGAEPLAALSVMRQLSPKLAQLASDYGCDYTATLATNGLALSPKIARELVDFHFVRDIEVTLDGDREAHDSRRYTKKRKPTFDIIYSNIRRVVAMKLDLRISIRCNVDRRNYLSVQPLIDRLISDNLNESIRFYVAPIHSWGNDAHSISLPPDSFAELELEWLHRVLDAGFRDVMLVPPRRYRTCIAVHPESELVDAYGSYFKCTEVSYVPSYGTPNIYELNDSYPSEPALAITEFNNDVAAGTYPCSRCSLLPVCGGGCPKRWAEGVMTCPSMKLNMPKRLRMAVDRLGR